MQHGRKLALSATGLAVITLTPLAVTAASTGNALAASAQKNYIRSVHQRTVTHAGAAARPTFSGVVQWPEFTAGAGDETEAAGTSKSQGHGPNRSKSTTHASQPPVPTSAAPTFAVSSQESGFQGVNLYQQRRVADNGNQFTVEPPDQGLCVGNNKVLEVVNDTLNIFDTNGNPIAGQLQSNNQFFGYPSEVVRHDDGTATYGPETTDPSCLYDKATNRWYLIVLTLDTDSVTGDLTGTNHLDLAVSQDGNPTHPWNFYSIDTTDDGSHGGPAHPNCPCLGDYPHIGANANGLFITTNEYEFFGDGFNGAQVYALPKSLLASGAQTVQVTQIDTSLGSGHSDQNVPGFTLWPAQAPPGGSNVANTEYFLSSNAASEVGALSSQSIVLWTLTGSNTLASTAPNVGLQPFDIRAQTYYLPPKGTQAPGDWPLGQCLGQTSCAKSVNDRNDPYKETIGPIDTNDTRMQQVMWSGGLLYGALDTAVLVGSPARVRAGVAWYAVDPSAKKMVNQGQFGVANADVSYPAIGVNSAGKGAMAMTLAGDTLHPSAAYVPLSGGDVSGTSVITVGSGRGVQDGFSEYRGFGAPFTPRWGDYGAAAVDESGNTWLASEYIAQTCTLSAWLTDPTCGNTRAPLGNWSTHVARVPAH